MSVILGLILYCLPSVCLLLLLAPWQSLLQKFCCTCNGTLRQSCPRHGWEQAEPIGPAGGTWIEYVLGQYLDDEAKDVAWFEDQLELFLRRAERKNITIPPPDDGRRLRWSRALPQFDESVDGPTSRLTYYG